MLVLHEFVLDTKSTQNTDRAHTNIIFLVKVDNHKFIFSVQEMTRKIVFIVSLAECTDREFNLLIRNFIDLIHEAPFSEISLSAHTANMTIINKYFTKPIRASCQQLVYTNCIQQTDESFITTMLTIQ